VLFLSDLLAGGPIRADGVHKAAGKDGITKKSLRRAQERLGIKPKKSAFKGGWVWELPHEDAPIDEGALPQDVGILGAVENLGEREGEGVSHK